MLRMTCLVIICAGFGLALGWGSAWLAAWAVFTAFVVAFWLAKHRHEPFSDGDTGG